MRILDASLTLEKMESLLEKELERQGDNIRILGDMNLSLEDYKCLSLKLKGMQTYQGGFHILEKYKLSLLTTWVFSLRYEKETKIAFEKIQAILYHLPQYVQRQFIQLTKETILEYHLCNYFIDLDSIKDLCAILAIHAGVPDASIDELFLLIYEAAIEMQDSYFDRKDSIPENSEEMVWFLDHVMRQMPIHMKEIYQYLSYKKLREIFYITKNMFLDCYRKEESEETLLRKYPITSKKLISGCVLWCKEWKQQTENRKIK